MKLIVVTTADNRGDLFTKALAGPRMDTLSRRLALRHHAGAGEALRELLRKVSKRASVGRAPAPKATGSSKPTN